MLLWNFIPVSENEANSLNTAYDNENDSPDNNDDDDDDGKVMTKTQPYWWCRVDDATSTRIVFKKRDKDNFLVNQISEEATRIVQIFKNYDSSMVTFAGGLE